jgi:hypothetical protein
MALHAGGVWTSAKLRVSCMADATAAMWATFAANSQHHTSPWARVVFSTVLRPTSSFRSIISLLLPETSFPASLSHLDRLAWLD